MKTRYFPGLRKRVTEIIEELYASNPDKKFKESNHKPCSKHWWFNYMKKNPDIKKLWEEKPQGRPPKNSKLSEFENKNNLLNESYYESHLTYSNCHQFKIEIPLEKSYNDSLEEIQLQKIKLSSSLLPEYTKTEETSPKQEEFQNYLAFDSQSQRQILPKMEEIKIPIQPTTKIEEEGMMPQAKVEDQSQNDYLASFPIGTDPIELLLRRRRMLDLTIFRLIHERNQLRDEYGKSLRLKI